MKPVIWIFLFSLFFSTLLSACGQTSSKEMILVVGSQQVDCKFAPTQKCYQVKYPYSTGTDWVDFPDEIQGFEWEAGYEYELRVDVHENRPSNSDFTFRSFELIEVLRKTQVK